MKFIMKCNKAGFSLIELLVVVSIIGLLATFAVPQYRKFKVKAMQAEAKTMLANIYAAEISFIMEWDYGTSNFKQLGFDVNGDVRYKVGWPTAQKNAVNNNINSTTRLLGYMGPLASTSNQNIVNTHLACPDCLVPYAGKSRGSLTPIKIREGTRSGSCSDSQYTTPSDCTTNSETWTHRVDHGALAIDNQGASVTFRIGAVGNLGFKSGNDDQWTLDQNKKLVNTHSGISF